MEMENLKEEDFEIEVVYDGDIIELLWKGSLHAINPDDFLDPYFEKLLSHVKEKNLSIKNNFVNLDYMNSASIPPLIQLLRELAKNEISGEFIYDSKRKVQAASFRALDVIAKKSEFTKVVGI